MKKRKYLLPSFISLQLLLESLVPAPLSASGVHQETKTSEQVSISVESVNKKRPTNLWASAKIRQASNGLFMGHRSHSSHSSHRSHSSHSSHSSSSHSSHYSHSSGGSGGSSGSGVWYPPKTTTTTTVPTNMLPDTGRKGVPFKFETCWSGEGATEQYVGLPVRLEVKRGKNKWFTPLHTPGDTKDAYDVIGTICDLEPGNFSAVTFWTPLKSGNYQLRHVVTYNGYEIISAVAATKIS